MWQDRSPVASYFANNWPFSNVQFRDSCILLFQQSHWTLKTTPSPIYVYDSLTPEFAPFLLTWPCSPVFFRNFFIYFLWQSHWVLKTPSLDPCNLMVYLLLNSSLFIERSSIKKVGRQQTVLPYSPSATVAGVLEEYIWGVFFRSSCKPIAYCFAESWPLPQISFQEFWYSYTRTISLGAEVVNIADTCCTFQPQPQNFSLKKILMLFPKKKRPGKKTFFPHFRTIADQAAKEKKSLYSRKIADQVIK